MVVVPHGAFTMGTSTSKSAIAAPARRVVIAKAFAVGRFAVSFAEWDACVDDGGCNGYRPPDEGWGRGNRPVINVNWEDADAFTKWLTRKTGHAYQLLFDKEREYVARAGTQTSYWWGNDIDLDRANYDLPVSARPNEGEAAELAKPGPSPVTRKFRPSCTIRKMQIMSGSGNCAGIEAMSRCTAVPVRRSCARMTVSTAS